MNGTVYFKECYVKLDLYFRVYKIREHYVNYDATLLWWKIYEYRSINSEGFCHKYHYEGKNTYHVDANI